MKLVLGISAFYHDSSAALLRGNEILAAAQEERFTRKKNTADFPIQAIKYCLEEGGVTIDELDAVVFYDKPFLKFERLLETYYAFAPKGFISFLKSMPVWVNEKLFLKRAIRKGLKEAGSYDAKKLTLLFCEHHLSHAASAFFPSPYNNAAILTIDGVGEWSTASIGIGENHQIKILKELNFPHSVGLLYSAFTYFLGFKVNSGEYKLMGLAPFGNKGSEEVENFKKKIVEELVSIKEDGSIWLNQKYYNYATGLKMIRTAKWEALFKLSIRKPEENLNQQHCDLALAIQEVTEDIVYKMALETKRLTQADYLCMAGGVALNCVANGKLVETGLFKKIYIQPAAGDAGGSLGAAFAIQHMFFTPPSSPPEGQEGMKGTYLGPSFSDKEIRTMCKKTKATYDVLSQQDLLRKTASLIAEGNVIGWFQGRMEFGPRALGNRSILADPRNEDMQKVLNLKIKFREGFRPFAPAVTAEDASHYFEMGQSSDYMQFVFGLQESHKLTADLKDKSISDKLSTRKSSLPAITHVDYSARVQTVNKETNPRFHALLCIFKELTGIPVLINTSFNVRGEPIVCTPLEAYRCFMATDMDYLVIENFLFTKSLQPNPEDKLKWTTQYDVD